MSETVTVTGEFIFELIYSSLNHQEIVVSDEPAVGIAESTEEEELPQSVDVQKDIQEG